MDASQFLYHGTTAFVANKAIKEGLRPRGEHGRTNWKHTIESNPKAVYLTDAYPLYFAFNCTKHKGQEAAVIQIATDRLDQLWLVPDEDVLEQAGRKHDDVPGDMITRTRHYRDNIADYLCTEAWKGSLQGMGTCGSLKPIPPSAITRIAFLKAEECPLIWGEALDPTLVLANYQLCGAKYRNLTNKLFGLEQEPDPMRAFDAPREGLDEATRTMFEQMATGRARYDEQLAEQFQKVRIVEVNP